MAARKKNLSDEADDGEEEEAFQRMSGNIFKVCMANANDKHIVRVYPIKDVPENSDKENWTRRTSVENHQDEPDTANDKKVRVEPHGNRNDVERDEKLKNEVEPHEKKTIEFRILGIPTSTKSLRIEALSCNPDDTGEAQIITEINGVQNKTGLIFTNEMKVVHARKSVFIHNWWNSEDGTDFKPQPKDGKDIEKLEFVYKET